jgi:hypothetical protein
MASVDYKTIYDTAIAHLTQLMEEREELELRRDSLDKQISVVKDLIQTASAYIAENPSMDYPELFPGLPGLMAPISDLGFTGGIRKILSSATDWMSPVMVRGKLQSVGYANKSKNILPSIHTVLKRLEQNNEVESKDVEGRTWYRWNPAAPKYQEPVVTMQEATAVLDYVLGKILESSKKPSRPKKKAAGVKLSTRKR